MGFRLIGGRLCALADALDGWTVACPGDPVGAENQCRLGGCSTECGPASSAARAVLGPSRRAMIFGLWA